MTKTVNNGVTVGQLKEMLEPFSDKLLVVVAKDSEGNEFSPCVEIMKARYEPNTDWAGELAEGRTNCVVIWPTN